MSNALTFATAVIAFDGQLPQPVDMREHRGKHIIGADGNSQLAIVCCCQHDTDDSPTLLEISESEEAGLRERFSGHGRILRVTWFLNDEQPYAPRDLRRAP